HRAAVARLADVVGSFVHPASNPNPLLGLRQPPEDHRCPPPMDLEHSPRSVAAEIPRVSSQLRPKVSIEPGLRPLDRIERVRSLNRHVSLPRIDDELDLRARFRDRAVELVRLARWCAPVLGPLD